MTLSNSMSHVVLCLSGRRMFTSCFYNPQHKEMLIAKSICSLLHWGTVNGQIVIILLFGFPLDM